MSCAPCRRGDVMKYSAETLHWFYQTTHAWLEPEPPKASGYARRGLLGNGDVLELWVWRCGDVIERCVYRIRARLVTMACAEYCASWCEGRTVTEVQALTSPALVRALQLSDVQLHAADLVLGTLSDALRDTAHGSKPQTGKETG
jgi:nitrogen fixation NifU-like protein